MPYLHCQAVDACCFSRRKMSFLHELENMLKPALLQTAWDYGTVEHAREGELVIVFQRMQR